MDLVRTSPIARRRDWSGAHHHRRFMPPRS